METVLTDNWNSTNLIVLVFYWVHLEQCLYTLFGNYNYKCNKICVSHPWASKYMLIANVTIIHLYSKENLPLPCDKPWCSTGIHKHIYQRRHFGANTYSWSYTTRCEQTQHKEINTTIKLITIGKTPMSMNVLFRMAEPCGLRLNDLEMIHDGPTKPTTYSNKKWVS